ncbi:MAG: hypothetical protein WA771_03655 [Chthoniobacterales bacterium]
MRRPPAFSLVAVALLSIVAFVLAGCLVTPVGQSGGMGSVTIPDTSRMEIIDAAQDVFSEFGYEPGPSDFPDSISFDKPSGVAGQVAYGSYGETTTMRVKLAISEIAGTSDFRVSPAVFSVNDAGQAGFEDPTRRSQLLALEFKPILEKVRARAMGGGSL